MAHLREKNKLMFIGVSVGVAYGLITRLVLGEEATLASMSFLFVFPAILGIVPLLFAHRDQLLSYKNILFIPWLTIASVFLAMILTGLEEVACLMILAAPFFALGTVGALILRLIQLHRERSKLKLSLLVLLPFLLAPAEQLLQTPSSVFTIDSDAVVTATPEIIWNNIVEVKTIREDEYKAGFFHAVGIPRPIRATVDRRAAGGRRVGNFEGGLTFIERINRFEPVKTISFDIAVDPKSVRPTVFDQHVLNGNYFTFVDATYTLTPLAHGQVRLTLSSRYRLTSQVNFYGKIWGDLILEDFQDRLLDVIQQRCEAHAAIH